jgi:P-type Ca2+ transporter type 2C
MMTTEVVQSQERPVWHALPAAEAAARLGVRPQAGLPAAEVAARREQWGPNELRAAAGRTLGQMLGEQFREIVIWVLLGATVVSAALGEYLDAGVIVAIVILNAVMGVLQERKAEAALASLQQLAAPTARLLRDGAPVEVPANEVVPGDVVLLDAGSRVPADARLLESASLRLDEASLTGESLPVEKDAAATAAPDAPLAERPNMVYMGSAVTQGRGQAVVVATGCETELGQIAVMVGDVEAEKTPLQARLEDLGKWLALAVLLICAVVFVAGALRRLPLLDLFLTSVSLAVAAIPEGLPAVVTIVLALGMQNMVQRHVIVRKLRAVEALGSTTVICTDKTGTLTENQMTVRRYFTGSGAGTVTGEGYDPVGEFAWHDALASQDPSLRPPRLCGENSVPRTPRDEDLCTLLELAVLCNDARHVERDGAWQILGDPTEGALLVAAAKAGLRREALEEAMPRGAEVPFDADRKRMSTLHARGEGVRACVKGAPGRVLECCTHWQREGRTAPLAPADRQAILAANAAFADEALRVLGFAHRDLDAMPQPVTVETVEAGLVFVGLLGMIDPPRPEARAAVARCRDAGVRPVMVTGDNPATAQAVARELDLVPAGALTISGADLHTLSEAELAEKLPAVTLFARVSPADKLRIVHAYQARGEIVAMTGDGVNDAPALKRADIGVAMGITGTDVAKEAADMVLMDDNFASIVAAVEEGRGIFENIRKFVVYLLSCNISEVLTIFLCILAGLPSPLIPVQVLWVNLVTDGLPALALGVDPKEPGLMDRPPRDPSAGVLDRETVHGILWYGAGITVVTMLAFLHGLYWYDLQPRGYETLSEALGVLFSARFWSGADLRGPRTLAFTTLALSQLAHAFNCRSDSRSLFARHEPLPTNWHLIAAVGLSALAQLMVVYVPLFQRVFETVRIEGRELAVLVLLSLAPLLFGELRKAWKRRLTARVRFDYNQ